MANITDQFISSFHSISGTTIGERRKNLYLLFKTIPGDNLNLSQLNPQTHLENVFKIEALIYYRKIPQILDVLKSENLVLICKVLKCEPWFFKEAFANINGEELNQLFLQISFQVKVKLLHKLSLCLDDEVKLDEYFMVVRKNYGLYLANKLLPACSVALIIEVFQSSRVILSPGDFLRIIKKHPDVAEQIFNSLNSYLTTYQIKTTYKDSFVHLAKINHLSFWTLFFEYKPIFRLGWRSTQKTINKNKDVVITHAVTFSFFLHTKQIFKTMGKTYCDFYIQLFPETISIFESSLNFLLQFVKAIRSNEEKLFLLEETFKNVYKSDLLKISTCLKKGLLDLIPIEKFELLPKPDKSIPLIKKQIQLTSDVSKRTELISNLVETCGINRDKVALADVCKYFLERHRNDDVRVRQRFLSTIRHSFKLEELEQVHWDPINDLIAIFELNKEGFGLDNEFSIAFIKYRFLNSLPIDDLLVEYSKSTVLQWRAFRKYPLLEKQFLTLMGQVLPHICKPDTLVYKNCQFLSALIEWNELHCEDPISLLSQRAAIQLFKNCSAEKMEASQKVIVYFLRKQPHEVDYIDGDFLNLCLSKLDSYSLSSRLELKRLLKYKPLVVLSNIDIVTELALKYRSRVFWEFSKNYDHLGIPELLEKKLLNEFDRTLSQSVVRRRALNTLRGLSILTTSNKFLQWCIEYHPQNLRCDLSDPNSKNRYIMQESVAKSLKNVLPPSLAIESLLQFCKGDYLKLILSSLYSLANRMNENRLPTLLDELASRPISVQKHSLHLTLRTLNKIQAEAILKKLMDKHHNPSMRKYIFKASFSLFIQDPNVNLWNLLKTNLAKIDDKDREVGTILTRQISKVSIYYIIEYISLTCDYLENHPDETKLGEEYDFLRQLPKSVIERFPIQSHTSLVGLFSKKLNSSALGSLVCKSIIYAPHDVPRISCLGPIFEKYFNKSNKRYVVSFVEEFCLSFLQRECYSLQILETFATLWYSHIARLKAFKLHLHLQLSLIYVRCTNENLTPFEIGKKLSEFCDLTANSYGVAVSGILGRKLEDFYHRIPSNFRWGRQNSCCSLMDGMIKNSSSSASLIVVSFLLEPSDTCQHNEIKAFMREVDDPSVVAYLSTLYEFNCH